MIDCLASGKIFGAPTQRTSKGGSVFVTGKLRVAMGEASTFVNFICFRETVGKALLALADGTPCAIAGDMTIKTYVARDGATKPSIDITVSEILTPHHVSRRRKAMTGGSGPTNDDGSNRERELPFGRQPAQPAAAVAPEPDFDDAIPF